MPIRIPARPIDPDFPVLPPRVPFRRIDFEINKFWFKKPETVRILMYMDGSSFLGDNFSLDHVINGITSDPWPWAKFEVTTAHRGDDPTADFDNVNFTDLDLDDYDEIFIFGFNETLTGDEVAAIETFMDAGGGMFSTGDHANLGKGMAEGVKRLGKMREYDSPPPGGNDLDRLTTIQDANADGFYSSSEQSDATPQIIRPRYWYAWHNDGGFSLSKFPHPVLCAEDGVLRKLPDHQHEGLVTVPDSFPASEWPKNGSFQPKAEVIAWGKVLDDTAAAAGAEFPVIGAYDGQGVDVGRIVVDSTWHHWFNINLDGFDPLSDDYRDIISYFQNVAAWLAPKSKQRGMRNGVFWLALHESVFQQVDFTKLALPSAIKAARDALGRWAPQCAIHSWVLDAIPRALLPQLVTTDPLGPKLRQPLEDTILVEAVTMLQKHFDMQSGVLKPATSFTIIDEAIAAAVPRASKRLLALCEKDMQEVSALDLQVVDLVGGANGNGSAPARPRSRSTRKRASARSRS